jgi:hypothetical protein
VPEQVIPNYGAVPVEALLAGLIASHAGVRAALWIMLTGLVLSSLVLLAGPLPRLRDLPAAAPGDVPAEEGCEQRGAGSAALEPQCRAAAEPDEDEVEQAEGHG